MAALTKGLDEDAKALLLKGRDLVVFPGWAEFPLALIALRSGDEACARRLLAEMIEARKTAPVSPISIAWLAASLGDLDLAFAFFDTACEERDTLTAFVHVYTRRFVPSLLVEPRFEALLARLRIPRGA